MEAGQRLKQVSSPSSGGYGWNASDGGLDANIVGRGIELGGPVRCNRSAAARRVASLMAGRSVKGDAQTAWLLKAVTCIDLTTLAGDDTAGRVRRLCAKARCPVDARLLTALGMATVRIRCAAVCVYPRFVKLAVQLCKGSGVVVVAVVNAFPAGLGLKPARAAEVRAAVRAGADEIDMVVTRANILTGDWAKLHREVSEIRAACPQAVLKVILSTGELGVLRNVMRSSIVAMDAGADFIKTSTGKEAINATPETALAMARVIRALHEHKGKKIGFKPAGGLASAKDALCYQVIMREELGRAWLEPELFRLGASSLLGDIERQLEHCLTGAYSSSCRHGIT